MRDRNAELQSVVKRLGITTELFWEPVRLTSPPPWAGHIPFAFWLAGAAAPAVFVELGTHSGNSYAAFCQGLAEHRVPARAYAVDTWEGDEHSGRYGAEVFADLHAFNEARFSGFSKLLRTSFDDASLYFAEGSVDLLHMDGLHTYEAVRSDYERWLPNLSPRAVVVFHDINVRERGFGVWRLWEELRSRFPAFEFHHSEGLGVLGAGNEQAEAMRALFGLSESEAATARQLFAARGTLFRHRVQEAELERRLRDVSDEAERLRAERNAEAAPLEGGTALRRIARPARALADWMRGLPDQRPARSSPALHAEPAAEPAPSDLGAALREAMRVRLEAFLGTSGRLVLPRDPDPAVTVLLVLFNQAELTFACLQSIRECAGEAALEVVIVDNGSTDRTCALLDRIEGAAVVRSGRNLHPSGVNRAAREAKGRHILLLGSDVQLLPGALAAALRTLESADDAGAVGGRIVLPDGTLEEAGSIIWNDGTTQGYAGGWRLDDPAVLFRRNVDFCSAAFLLTPRRLFEHLGGCDPVFAPSCFEEADYCVRLRRAGYRVVYEPDVTVQRCKPNSPARPAEDLELGQRSRLAFRERHADWLCGQQTAEAADISRARFARPDGAAPAILVVGDRVPREDRRWGDRRLREMVRTLVEAGARVTFYPTLPHLETWPEARRALGGDVEIAFGSSGGRLDKFLLARSGQFDAVIVSHPRNMRSFLDAAPGDALAGARIFYDAGAIAALAKIRRRALRGDPLPEAEGEALVHEELAPAGAATVLAASEREAALFRGSGARDVRVLTLPLTPTPTAAPFEARSDILLAGAVQEDGLPDMDALQWFVREALPELRARLGQSIRLKVIGDVKAPAVQALGELGCDFLGAADDLRPHFEAARVFVAPARFAAGAPLEVYTSASFGVPVVTTRSLAGQAGWQDGRDLLAADDPSAFAQACARLYEDAELWAALRRNGLERCAEACSPEAFRPAVEALVREVPVLRPAPELPAPAFEADRPDYAEWVMRFDTLGRSERAAVARRVAEMPFRPLISVVVPLYNTPPHVLRRCIESVLGQLYDRWELCLVDDASSDAGVAAICREFARRDGRVHFKRRAENGHIAAASNDALRMATGEFVALLDHDDVLAPHALSSVAEALNENPALDLIFSDEDKIDEDGRRSEPWFKTGWNYDLMLSQNCVVHLGVFRRAVLEGIGGFRSGYDGSQDYDLTLRFLEASAPDRIRHIPAVLYHWRIIPGSVAAGVDEKLYPYEAARRAIQEHLDRRGAGAVVERQRHPGYYRVRWPLPAEAPRVSLIIPTRDKAHLLSRAVQSILDLTLYGNYEIVVVDNGSREPDALAYLESLASNPRVRVLPYPKPFSFSALNNHAVEQVASPIIAFVNNDVEAITPGWLGEMVSHALRPEVGAVGAKLLYPDETIQHAGVTVGIGGTAGHPHVGQPRAALGYFGRLVCTQRFSAVSGACLVMRRDVFQEIGGFNETEFGIAFNDVDLGLRLNEAGYAVVWTPFAELLHHESASLGDAAGPERRARYLRECASLRRLWPEAIRDDPFYNPNLSIRGGDFRPAFPPRAAPPWAPDRLSGATRS